MNMPSLDGLHFDLTTLGDILQIVFADIILSGDNALVIGMAAAGLARSSEKGNCDRNGHGRWNADPFCRHSILFTGD